MPKLTQCFTHISLPKILVAFKNSAMRHQVLIELFATFITSQWLFNYFNKLF